MVRRVSGVAVSVVVAMALLAAVSGCGGGSSSEVAPTTTEAPTTTTAVLTTTVGPTTVVEPIAANPVAGWAAEALAWFESLRAAQAAEGGAAFQRYLSSDVVWEDGAILAGDYGSAPIVGTDSLEEFERLRDPDVMQLQPDCFVSADSLVMFWLNDWAPFGWDFRPDTGKPAHVVGVMREIGSSGAEFFHAGRAAADWHDRRPDLPQADEGEAIASAWVQVWSGSGDVDSLYHRDVLLRDTIAGIDAAGRDVITELARSGGHWEIATVDPGGVPGVFAIIRRHDRVKALDEVVIVVSGHDGDGCVGEITVWLDLEDGLVIEEVRYWSVERGRACLPADDLPDGWWTGREIPYPPPDAPRPVEDLDTPTDPVVVGDVTIPIYHGTPALNRLMIWALNRFDAAGLTPPAIESVTFTRFSTLCDEAWAAYQATAEGAQLTLCFDDDRVCEDEACGDFTAASRLSLLHELAHAWMYVTLDDDAEQRFTDHVGLEHWNNPDIAWDHRAIEHAAETIAWGLMDHDMRMLQIGYPSSEELIERFRILTDTEPLH